MKRSVVGDRLLHGLKSMSLLGIVGLAVLALGPGLVPIFGTDGAGALAFSRPAAPAVQATQPVSVSKDGNEAIVLANWEFTSNHHGRHDGRHNGDAEADRDVLQALQLVNQANFEAAEAVGDNRSKAGRLDRDAARNVLKAADQLAVAAGESRNQALAADAQAMLLDSIKMYQDIQARNIAAVYQDTVIAEKIANKAVLDASPYR